MRQTDTIPFDTTGARALADEYGGRLRAIVHEACDEIDTHRAITLLDALKARDHVVEVASSEATIQLRQLEKRLDTIERSLHAVSGNSAAISRRVNTLEDQVGPVKLTEAMPAIHERIGRLEGHAGHDLDGHRGRGARLEMPKGAA